MRSLKVGLTTIVFKFCKWCSRFFVLCSELVVTYQSCDKIRTSFKYKLAASCGESSFFRLAASFEMLISGNYFQANAARHSNHIRQINSGDWHADNQNKPFMWLVRSKCHIKFSKKPFKLNFNSKQWATSHCRFFLPKETAERFTEWAIFHTNCAEFLFREFGAFK